PPGRQECGGQAATRQPIASAAWLTSGDAPRRPPARARGAPPLRSPARVRRPPPTPGAAPRRAGRTARPVLRGGAPSAPAATGLLPHRRGGRAVCCRPHLV